MSAARRALRTAVVTVAAFAIGRWGIGNVQVAVFATFTGLAVTGIADFGGSMCGRAAAVATTVALGIGLTAFGTWISSQGPWVGSAVMFTVVAAIVLAGLLGGYAAAGSNALILFYVVAAGSAAPVATIPDRVEGVAMGGGLSLIAAVGLLPEPEHRPTLPLLGAALEQLAARLARLARGGDHPLGPSRAAPGIRATIDALLDRPAAPTGSQRAELYLLNDIERATGIVTSLERTEALGETHRPTLEACARTLQFAGAALSSGHAALKSRPAAPTSQTDAAPFSVCSRLSAVTNSILAHADASLRRSPDGSLHDVSSSGSPIPGRWADVIHGWRRLRANLTPRSVHVHDALRLGAGLALASAAAAAFGLQHGFWVAFAALTVIKSNLRATGRSVGEAIAGTFTGFLLAFVLIAGVEPSIGWYFALLPVVVAAAIYANVAVSFFAGQAGFTVVIIVLFNLLGPAGWRIGIVRVVDVAAGGLAGLLIAALAWPRGASATMRTTAADLLEAGGSYLAAAARELAGKPPDETLADTRQIAADAALRAESNLAQYLTEHPPPADVEAWAHWLSTGNRLWYAADLIVAAPRDQPVDVAETVRAADRLRAGYKQLAGLLRGARRPLPPPAILTPGGGSALSDWLDDLAADTAAPQEREVMLGGV
jgi:uncharacterized membrane protein YccC